MYRIRDIRKYTLCLTSETTGKSIRPAYHHRQREIYYMYRRPRQREILTLRRIQREVYVIHYRQREVLKIYAPQTKGNKRHTEQHIINNGK